MAKSKSSKISTNLLTAIAYAIIGLLLIILKGGSLGILMTVIGVLLVALGIVDVVKNKQTIKGIIEAILGIVIIVCGWTVADIVLLVFGIVLIVKGILEFVKVYKNGFGAMLSPLVTIVIGILLVIARWTLLDVICIIAGVIFLVNAVLVLLGKKLAK